MTLTIYHFQPFSCPLRLGCRQNVLIQAFKLIGEFVSESCKYSFYKLHDDCSTLSQWSCGNGFTFFLVIVSFYIDLGQWLWREDHSLIEHIQVFFSLSSSKFLLVINMLKVSQKVFSYRGRNNFEIRRRQRKLSNSHGWWLKSCQQEDYQECHQDGNT